MSQLTIQTEGLTIREVEDLKALLSGIDGIEVVQFRQSSPDRMEFRSASTVLAALDTLHIIVRLSEAALAGTALEAGRHLYRKIGETLADKLWEAFSAKLTGRSNVNAAIKLYGPDGELIRRHEGKR